MKPQDRTMPQTRRASRFRHLLCALVGLILSVAPGHVPVGALQVSGVVSAGQSITVLPDGRRLRIGGDASRSAVAIEDLQSGSVVVLPVSALTPRAWHTATLLADGTVLLVGGVDASGRIISAPERFNPATQSFERLPADGFAVRAKHTATLLTDGRVLIVGGETAAGGSDAEVWDPETESASVLPNRMLENRVQHEAALLPDGRVLLEGGQRPTERPGTAEVFNPLTNGFEPFARRAPEPRALSVVAFSPADGAVDVPAEARVIVRFSSPMASTSVTTATVSLSGPGGPVSVLVVPAEGGMLAFVTPLEPLAPDTPYTFTVNGPAAADGRSLRPFSIRFRTAEEPAVAQPGDLPEEWVPNPEDGRGWRINQPDSPWQKLPPLQAPPGVTALAGQALRLTGQPLADMTLTIRGLTARTDRTGRFLLLLNGFGSGRYQLEIEGATASRPGRTYGFYEAGVKLTGGQTNVLPYTIWMSKIDTAHAVTIASPTASDVVITTPKIPGLELHVPRGTVIKNRDGSAVRTLSITPIPIDRPPFPLPSHVEVPVYFTIQPGGAVVYSTSYGTRKARLIYPNYQNAPQGIIASFWHYDPEELDWYVYGPGRVTGKQVVPDPGVGIYEFTGAMMDTNNPPPDVGPAPGGGPAAGDPVDVATGLLVVDKVDLALPDVLPIALTRTYRPNDPVSRPFGIGATHPYAMRLWSAQNYQQADLVLPDGGRIHYVRISPGTAFWDAVYEHTATPTPFYKSKIIWNGGGWDLTLRDGTVYVFGDFAPLQSIRDRFGNAITVEHTGGAGGPVSRVVSQNGRWLSFTYDGSNRVTQVKDNIGRTVGYQYDAGGRLWKVTDARGGVTEYTYDTSHRMLSIKDARGIVYLTNTYDANGRVATQTQADNTTWTFAYTVDAMGKVTQADVTNPRGHVTRSTFNANGYQLSSTEALGLTEERTITYTRDATSNRVTSATDPLTRVTSYGYDANGNLTNVTRLSGTPDAVTTTFEYGPSDLLTSITDTLNHTTSIGYDAQDRIQSATNALSQQTMFQTNLAGQVVSVTDPLSQTTTFTYEGADLSAAQTPQGHITSQFTDAAGRVVRTTDPNGSITRFEYNARNQVTKVTDSRGGETTFTSDGNGNLLTLTDARGKTTTWTYNNMDRVATRTDPLNRQESFVYDGNGNLTHWTDRKGQVTTYQYDALDRQTFVGFGTTGTPPTYASTTTTTYDAGNRATAIVDSGAGTISRTYDLLDRLTQETTPEGTVSYTHDAADRRATMTVAGQTTVSYTYDNTDRLTAITQGSASVAMAHDNAGRLTSLTLPNGIVHEYGYDADSRLTGIAYKLGSSTLGDLTYTYDTAGRRTSVGGTYARTALPPSMTSATYDDANQIENFGGTTFTYDANGNLTSDGVRSYTWDARNQLASLTGPVNATFAYDGFGRRRSKTIGGATTAFLYDGLNPVHELAGGSPVANLLTGLGIDEFFTRTDGAGERNYLTDALGSSVALADASGTVQTEYTYEAFGGTTVSGGSTMNAIGFTGREADGTGLYFYRARYYQPQLQRFLSEDPAFNRGRLSVSSYLNEGSHLYAYVRNSPTLFRDPSGEQTQVIVIVAPTPPGLVVAGILTAIAATPWGQQLIKDAADTVADLLEKSRRNNDKRRQCMAQLVNCLQDPWQPDWNKCDFGQRKPCGDCYRECTANGKWPNYKCPT
jgi:RHS repeat-associated protein